MISILRNPTYAKLLAAQVVALVGTGLLTVALGLLAFDLAGANAGIVLGIAYTLKMVTYVGLSPLIQALVVRLPRKGVLMSADLVRAGVALCLPFVTEVWQIYVLIFTLQTASAVFTPTYQALLPDVLPAESEYTRALALSRAAYDIENVTSPVIAGLLLSVTGYSVLFLGTVIGFAASAALVWIAALPPQARGASEQPFLHRASRGVRLYLATPRLRGLLALSFIVAAVSGFVIVNTVVLVRDLYSGSETDLAWAVGAYGAGSLTAALTVPMWLDRIDDRSLLMPLGVILAVLMLGVATFVAFGAWPQWAVFLLIWAVFGALYSALQTPSGRLIRRSALPQDRPALFTAQFALSHACWLVTYPLAGWAGVMLGQASALALLGGLSLVAAGLAAFLWPRAQTGEVAHEHPELPDDHPHLKGTGHIHAHPPRQDGLHRDWPRP